MKLWWTCLDISQDYDDNNKDDDDKQLVEECYPLVIGRENKFKPNNNNIRLKPEFFKENKIQWNSQWILDRNGFPNPGQNAICRFNYQKESYFLFCEIFRASKVKTEN